MSSVTLSWASPSPVLQKAQRTVPPPYSGKMLGTTFCCHLGHFSKGSLLHFILYPHQ